MSNVVQERIVAVIPDHELLRMIGRGSYGEVWQARNVMGTPRAVKIVRRHDFEHTRPFDREFEGIQQYEPISRSHEGLVQVLHVGMDPRKDYFYYVMELADDSAVAGEVKESPDYQPRTLRDELFYRGALPVEECIEIGIALASALGYLHRHGLVHRDVKPSNIIFVNGRAKLADVGLVALMSDTRSMVGTEGFAAPEGTGRPRSDVYSLGRVLYECITGFDRLKFPDVPENWVGSSMGKTSFEFMEIVLRAAESEPKRRYANTEEMLADLALLQAGKSVRYIRRVELRVKRMMQVMVFSALGLTMAGGAWLYERTRREHIQGAESRAVEAQQETQKLLMESLLAEAQSVRLSGQAGAREKALAAVERARRIGVAVVPLRTQAASALGLLGVGDFGPFWPPDAAPGTRTAISKDGAFAVTWDPGGHTRTVQRLPEGERLLAEFELPPGEVFDLVMARGGRWLAVQYHDNRLEMRETRTGRLLWRQNGGRGRPKLDFSRDGEWLLTGALEGLMARRSADGESVLLVPGLPPVRQVLLAPDGTWAAVLVSEEKGFRIFSGLPGKMPGPEDPARMKESKIDSTIELKGASISGDSRYLAAAVSEDRLRIWELPSLQQVAWLRGHQRTVRGTAFDPLDSTIIASTAWDGTTRLWDIPARRQVLEIPAGGEEVVIAPGRGEILLRSWSGAGIRAASLSPRRAMQVLMLPAETPQGLFSGVQFDRKGRLLAAAGDGGVMAWDLKTGGVLPLAPGAQYVWRDVQFNPDSSALWVSGGPGLWRHSVRWSEEGQPVISPAEKRMEGPFAHLTSSGETLVAGVQGVDSEGNGQMALIHPDEPPRLIVPPWEPDNMAGSADGRWLAASRYPHPGGMLWDLQNPDAPGIPLDAPSRCMVSFLPHLPVLAIATDRDFRFLSLPGVKNPPPLPVLSRAAFEEVPGRLVCSADGKLLAATTGPAEVTLFDGSTFEKLATLDSKLTPFDSVLAFSPDGGKLALAGGVSRVVIWDIGWLREELTRRGLGW